MRKTTDVVVIGGGQAGLAMSRCLSEASVDHVVLERGRVAERWRSQRWDSLRLLTPNWQSRLPGFRYVGSNPDGFMRMPEVVAYFEAYRRSFDAPVHGETKVLSVGWRGDRYQVLTDRRELWQTKAVVVATGQNGIPIVPRLAADLDRSITQVVPTRYRSPAQIADGGVLVVGASATGAQLADELATAGRSVTLAVGRHTRLPRRYRGRDIMAWLDRMGVFDETPADVHDVHASRAQPSLQLVGRDDGANLDLNTLADRGVRLVGRVMGIDGRRAWFDDDLTLEATRAQRKMTEVLGRIDAYVDATAPNVPPPDRPEPLRTPEAVDTLDLSAERIRTVIWATGFRPSLPRITVGTFGRNGQLEHRGGVTRSPGLYLLGFNFMRRRKSSYIDGVGPDARELTVELMTHLEKAARPRFAA